MPSHLRAYNPFPPGGYVYIQGGPIMHTFPDIGLNIYQQADLVWRYRSANHLERASFPECVQDIDLYTCQRLGGTSRFCTDGIGPAPVAERGGGGCATCGNAHD